MAIDAFLYHRADILTPHVIAAAGDLMACALMAGGAGQFGSAGGTEMHVHGCRRIDHSGRDIAALDAVAAARFCMAFRHACCIIRTRYGPGQRKRGLARREVQTHYFMDLAVGFRQGYLVGTDRAVHA